MPRNKTTIAQITLPPGLSAIAKKEFARIKPELERHGYTAIDQPALISYLTHHALCVEAREALAKQGTIIITVKGQPQINPWHSILKQNSELVKKWTQELGFSPGSRKRLGISAGKDELDDDADLYGGE